MAKHKHADLIHAWADGTEIEWKNGANGCWYVWDCDYSPPWHPNGEYRIKPEEKKPVVRWLWSTDNGIICDLYSEEELKNADLSEDYPIKLEWSRTEFPE